MEVSPIFVRNDEAVDRVKISFSFKPTINCQAREFNFDRSSEESIITTTSRISVNIKKAFKHKLKNKVKNVVDTEEITELEMVLFDNNNEILGNNITNQEAWVTGRRANIQNLPYVVFLNTPTVTALKLPTSLIRGLIAVPEVI